LLEFVNEVVMESDLLPQKSFHLKIEVRVKIFEKFTKQLASDKNFEETLCQIPDFSRCFGIHSVSWLGDIRVWGYEFPSLEASRKAFEKFTKQSSKIWED